ncbi:methyltransferase domain-containing protein [Reyranella sp.]|uniref:methyltransferase domain-containing protein n=1 Tax=Reyranella sp. TaxID=1929291 RepID=UPI003BA88A73
MSDPSPTRRLLALMDHLGLGVAHVATQMPGDIAGLAEGHAERLGGVVLCVPTRLDPGPFAAVADRLAMISGDGDLSADVTKRGLARLAGARRHVLDGYDAPGWADVVADRTDEVVNEMMRLLADRPADVPRAANREGDCEGIRWHLEGSGPALLLLPFFLAPSQWAPAVGRLAEWFTVVTLGGPHLGGVAMLEDRAKAPTYRALFRSLVDLLAPAPGESILDVGCGAGSLDRFLARRLGPDNVITAIDNNPFLLDEASHLARSDGVADRIRFEPGNAEALPFDGGSFDVVFSVTVLEECDADRALAEMVRVARPGGRVGVAVRSLDLPQWWSLDVPESLRQRITTPPQSVGARGVADASLYRRAQAAGLRDLVCFPFLVTLDRPEGPIWRYREDHVVAQLSAEEAVQWHGARQRAAAADLLFMAHPMHCVVGRVPG